MVDVGISAAQPSRRYLNDKMAWNGNWVRARQADPLDQRPGVIWLHLSFKSAPLVAIAQHRGQQRLLPVLNRSEKRCNGAHCPKRALSVIRVQSKLQGSTACRSVRLPAPPAASDPSLSADCRFLAEQPSSRLPYR